MFFDARAAKLLQAGQHMVIDGCQGLRLMATASRKTWVYRFKLGDRMKQQALGHWPAMSVQEAASKWLDLREQRERGVDLVAQRKNARVSLQRGIPEPQDYTVRQLVGDYLSGHIESSRKAAGALAARSMLERLMDEDAELADGPVAAVTRAIAFKVLDNRKATPTSTAKLRSLLGSAWEYGLDAGLVGAETPNWWRSIMRGRLKSKGKLIGGEHAGRQRRVLRPDELRTLLAWMPNMHDLGRDVLQMYLWTCARGVEILSLRKEHIRHEGSDWWWTVPKSLTKNARFEQAVDLRIPLYGRSLKIVRCRLASVGESGWLFEAVSGEQYLQKDFSTYIYDLQPYSAKSAKRQGDGLVLPITGWSPHNLRRSSRTILASLGCPDEIGEAIIGHMPKGIVGTYNAYSYDAERQHWLRKLSDYLERLAA